MRIFVNNVDGYLAGALCTDLCKLSNHIIGTRKGRSDELIPPMVKRIVPRVEVRRLLKTVAACDVVIYDLHDADLEELEMVVAALHSSMISQDMVFILISSIGVWAHTQRGYEEVPGFQTPTAVAGSGTETAAAETAAAETSSANGEEEVAVEAETTPPTTQRPVMLRSDDYVRRVPAPKFLEWKAIETQVLALRSKGIVRPFVVCAGIPYGNGEEVFMGLMKAAWQTKDTLRVIGDGGNYVPFVHVRDCARLIRHLLQDRPSLEYHLAVDRGDVTQRAFIEAVASHYRLAYTPASITVAEALLAELADIMTIDLRLEPSPLMETSISTSLPPSSKQTANSSAAGAPQRDAAALEFRSDTKSSEPPKFRWWCEEGIVANVGKVADEFRIWRRLDPVRICIVGPPGSGAGQVGAEVAKRYNVVHVDLDDLIEENRNLDTPIGQQLRQELDAVAAAFANPKSQGPFLLQSSLVQQLVEPAIKTRPLHHRGWVLSGFPQTAEEATAFFFDGLAESKTVKTELVPDALMSLSSKEANCSGRLQALDRPMTEKEFQIRLDRWKKEHPEGCPGLADFIQSQLECGRVDVEVDGQAPETGPVVSPEEAVERGIRAVTLAITSKRPVHNFLPPLPTQPPADVSSTKEKTRKRTLDSSNTGNILAPDKDPATRKEEELKAQKNKEEQQRIEQIRKDELVKLEKHSEPLRQYLMQLVVPALTSGLVEVCQEMPSDPVGYLSEYLLVYSEAMRSRSASAAHALYVPHTPAHAASSGGDSAVTVQPK